MNKSTNAVLTKGRSELRNSFSLPIVGLPLFLPVTHGFTMGEVRSPRWGWPQAGGNQAGSR